MTEQKTNRVGEERLNNQGSLMKIIVYNAHKDIIVKFQDEHEIEVHTTYKCFKEGDVKNPYAPSVLGVGMLGIKYSSKINGERIKEYSAWSRMLQRCFDNKTKEKFPTYQNVTCCDEWLLYENFYEWLHEQENFNKWLYGEKWNLDKDIAIKNNKVYSPDTCCLVPHSVNTLFIKCNAIRGELPIGITTKNNDVFIAQCRNPLLNNKNEYIGSYKTLEDAFYLGYKPFNENIIKQVAQIEYDKGNITKQCYNAMMKYQVEITD